MSERDLQDYLFENPDVLFPNQVVNSKRREVFIEGRRIDLLFEVEGVHYIVELKKDTIKRETVGQIFEYYALMRMSASTAQFRMILVAPMIPDFRRLPLEEFGIRCVEIQHPPSPADGGVELKQLVSESKRSQQKISGNVDFLTAPVRISFEELAPPTTSLSMKLSQVLLRDGLLNIERSYPEYEVLPVRMKSGYSPDVFCFPGTAESENHFVHGDAWWAYSFGHSEEMPKNDVPNISICAQPWGLDFAVNAELQTSQNVMKLKIARSCSGFDELLKSHRNLQLQAWLKIEHQPRFYHWVLLDRLPYGSWNGQKLLDIYAGAEAGYEALRDRWIRWIEGHRPELSPGQMRHMNRTNRSLNLALRLVHSFEEDDEVWVRTYTQQQERFGVEYGRMKSLIDFFQ
jgi:hypothetical protein